MPHTCHAKCCPKPVPQARLMCLGHWRMVSRPLQSDVWAHYINGQERGEGSITKEYLAAADAAIDHVYDQEVKRGLHRGHARCGRAVVRPKASEQLSFGAKK